MVVILHVRIVTVAPVILQDDNTYYIFFRNGSTCPTMSFSIMLFSVRSSHVVMVALDILCCSPGTAALKT